MTLFLQMLRQIQLQVLKIISLILVLSFVGCASEPFVTDEGSAAAQSADRQNIEFQDKGVPRRPVEQSD